MMTKVQEMEEEAEALRNNLQELSAKNDTLQKEFFGTISENYQSQVEQLSRDNCALKQELKEKQNKLNTADKEIEQSSIAVKQWRNRYKEVENAAEELRQRLQKAEVDNHDLQRRLIDLDQEYHDMVLQNQEQYDGDVMKSGTAEAFCQTLTIPELLREIKESKKQKKENTSAAENGKGDTEDDVSDIGSSSSSKSASHSAGEGFHGNQLSKQVNNLAEDKLLQETILKDKTEKNNEAFNEDDIPEPITDSIVENSQTADVTSVSNNTVKSLQNEVLGYQLMIEKLKRRNQELREGAGAAMTQDDEEALEREVSALRGQVALLERNNRIFSDRERNELKQDLDHANKRCSSFQSQLQAIKTSLEYEEVEKLKRQLKEATKEAEELKSKIQEYETEDTSESEDGSSHSETSEQAKKYSRLLELEEEAEELKSKLDERDEDMRDRDVMIEELQHQLKNVKKEYDEEVEIIERKIQKREAELQEEIKELERDVNDKKELLKLKQDNLRNKSEQLEVCDVEIEKLNKEIQKKNKEIDHLRWEIETLQRENASLRQRIDRLKQTISSSNDPALMDVALSPVATHRSPTAESFPFRGRSRSFVFRSSGSGNPDLSRSDLKNRSSDSFTSNNLSGGFDEQRESTRPRRTYSVGSEIENPTDALREGIHEARETVHQMGDVLDTPRLTPKGRSPTPRSEFNFKIDVSPSRERDSSSDNKVKANKENQPKLDKTTKDKLNKSNVTGVDAEDKDVQSLSSNSTSSSSLSPDRSDEEEMSEQRLKEDHHEENKPMKLSITIVPSENNTKITEERSRDQDVGNLSFSPETVKAASKNFLAEYPDKSSVKSSSSSPAEKKEVVTTSSETSESDPTSRNTTSPSSPTTASIIVPNMEVPDRKLQKNFLGEFASQASEPEIITATKFPEHQPTGVDANMAINTSVFEPEIVREAKPLDQRLVEVDGVPSSPDVGNEATICSSPGQIRDTPLIAPVTNVPLLPDDRPTLIQEVAKAREEARKWFAEVTQSDREKRQLGRRLEALENELVRLKTVEDNYELLKKHKEDTEKVSRDLELVRAQADLASRKAEEARERNALLRAHLLDKEEIENENKDLRRSIENLRKRPLDDKTSAASFPLSEIQESVKATGESMSPSLHFTPPESLPSSTEKQLKEVKKSFEYIATNFADLVLKKHAAELKLAPQQAKVSKLKRKCLERDQLLAKLVLKLRKKKHDTTDDVSDSHDESIASSAGLDSILLQADRIIRSDVLESDSSVADDVIPKKKGGHVHKESKPLEGRNSPPRITSSLIRSLSTKSPIATRSPPTHRIYIAKHDYAPASKISSPSNDGNIPVTHSLLPNLQLFSGDTVVAIGNPDQREDGKLYQMAEVRGKIGFVPLAHLVAAEQVEGMQAFVQERGKQVRKKLSLNSSPEKIIDLYKKLEQAQLMVADKIDRNFKAKHPAGEANPDTTFQETVRSCPSTPSYHASVDYLTSGLSEDLQLSAKKRGKFSKEKRKEKLPEEDAARSKQKTKTKRLVSQNSRKDETLKAKESMVGNTKQPPINTSSDNRYIEADSSFSSVTRTNGIVQDHRTSTPIQPPSPIYRYRRRSSSLPPKRTSSNQSSRSEISTPGHFVSPKRKERSSSKERSHSFLQSTGKMTQGREESFRSINSSKGSVLMVSPQAPTFPVIEKTMGQKSMVICWTPPLLDMISRSNNVPVIGYEISVDHQRKVQVSGAYTNKAILGDLDLTTSLIIEIRTVSSVGTLSSPCEVAYTPNPYSSSTPVNPKHQSRDSTSMRSPKMNKHKEISPMRTTSKQKATALYDYDPAVDSPYKTHDSEIALRQGDEVILLGTPRTDGFCEVQVGRRRGIAPMAFLISDCDETLDSSAPSSTQIRSRKLRHKKGTRSKESSNHYESSNSSLQN